MKAGDKVHFLSDAQTPNGPFSGVVKISCGDQVLIEHSNGAEEFSFKSLTVYDLMKDRDGVSRWTLK